MVQSSAAGLSPFLSTEPPEPEEYDETADAFGHLSVDENQAVRDPHKFPSVDAHHSFLQIRYHGRSAGLHLLAKSDRTDDHQQLKADGMWSVKLRPGVRILDSTYGIQEVQGAKNRVRMLLSVIQAD